MAYFINIYRLLCSIRTDEVGLEKFVLASTDGRKVTYEGHDINVDDLKPLIERELDRYNAFVKEYLFFGSMPPSDILPKVEIEDIFDNLNNLSAGYSFLDDPQNDFHSLRGSYGKWLLSDRARADLFTYTHQGRVYWRMKHAFDLLARFEEARDILIVVVAVSPLLMLRATEFCRLPLRNNIQHVRSLRLMCHTLVTVNIQDKTSHQHLKDLCIPHALTREVAHALLDNLVVLRPFEEFLVSKFLDKSDVSRYHFSMWPMISEDMTDTRFRQLFGDVTYTHLKVRVAPQSWRGMITVFGRHMPEAKAYHLPRHHYFDVGTGHSTDMADKRYNPGGDSFHIPAGIQACLDWQKYINVGQGRPFIISDEELASTGGAPAEMNPGMCARRFVCDLRIHRALDIIQFLKKWLSAVEGRISATVTRNVAPGLEHRVREAVLNSMGDVAAAYFPVAPRVTHHGQPEPTFNITVHPSRLVDLRTFLKKPDAVFSCPEQAILLELMIEGKKNILGILGTGKGKTLTVMLHSKMYGRGRVTIVVLPLSSLHADLEERARRHGVTISRWLPNQNNNTNVHILYVSIEHLGFDSFVQ